MREFKLGDTVRIAGFSCTGGYRGQKSAGDTGVITTIETGDALLDGDEDNSRKWINLNDLELVTSKYPNPPHKHCDLQIEKAKGAIIQCWQTFKKEWKVIDKPRWDNGCIYRVAPTKTELRIAKIQDKIDSRQIQIDELRVKIDALKSGGGE